MRLIGLARLGKDAEARFTNEGDPVVNFSAAWNYGRKDGEGNRPSQWVELSFWGERAEKMSQYLLKGRQFYIIARDVHVASYDKRDGCQGFKLVGTVESVEFADGKQEAPQGGQQRAPSHARPQRSQPPEKRGTGTGLNGIDDDIPF